MIHGDSGRMCLTTAEAASELGISAPQLRRLARAGHVRIHKHGNRLAFDVDDIDALADQEDLLWLCRLKHYGFSSRRKRIDRKANQDVIDAEFWVMIEGLRDQ